MNYLLNRNFISTTIFEKLKENNYPDSFTFTNDPNELEFKYFVGERAQTEIEKEIQQNFIDKLFNLNNHYTRQLI